MVQTQSDVGSGKTAGTSTESPTDAAKQQAQEVAQQARDKASETKDQVRSKLRTQVDERTTEAGETLNSTLQDIKTVGQELRKQGKDAPARLADQAAEKGERVADYLQSADADRLLSDAEDFARRKPWAVVTGGLVLGFAASRLLKASSDQPSSQNALPSGSGSGMPATQPSASGASGVGAS